MPKRKQPRLPTALTLLALTVCPPIMRVTPTAAPTTNKATPADVVLSNSDNGTVVTLAQGQSLELTLEAHPTTGYAWQVVEVNSAILRQAGEATYTRANPIGTPGLGQEDVQTFRFQAISTGETTLKLVYVRPFTKDVTPIPYQTFTMQVVVSAPSKEHADTGGVP